MASLRSTIDGLGGEEIGQPGSQVSDVWVTGSVISDSMISGANIYATAEIKGVTFSGTDFVNGEGELQSVSVGSPSVFSAIIQAGSGVLSSGSVLWKVFGTAFTGQPTVTIANSKSIDKTILAGSIGTGSFLAQGEAGADTFSWIAVGL